MEIWKDVPGFEDYKVSNLGIVKNKFDKILKPTKDKYYSKVGLYKNKIQTKFCIHQLVAMAFLNHKPNGYEMVVNHKNFDGYDNRVTNIEVVTQRENSNKKHIKSSSKHTGVSWHKKNKKWVTHIFISGKLKNLGYNNCEKKASEAYNDKLKEINQ